jgi:amidase
MRAMPSAPLAPTHADPATPWLEWSALEQAARIRDGSLTSRALTEGYLGRIRRHDPALGAFVHLRADDALREADALDRLRAKGRLLGPFHGVPTGLKDLHFMRGTPTRMGSRAYRWLWSPIDDSLARTLRKSGFVVLGKTATSELALLPICETDLHPPSRNPWNRAHSSGGSSGGAGAAVAAGLVPIAPGSDGAGSIRIPSALNGLFGLKPTARLVPDDADRIDTFRMTSLGPMARSVDDCAALLDLLARPDASRGRTFLEASREPAGKLRVGLVLEPPFGETDPRIVAVVRRAAARLAEAGHVVEERPRIDGTLEEFLPIYQSLFARIPVLFPGSLTPVVRWFRDEGRRLPGGLAQQRFRELAARASAAIDGYDLLLSPTTAALAPEVGKFAHLPPLELFRAIAPLGAFTAASNVTGAPALSVPCGTADGLPVGVQLIGRHGDDGRLFAVARLLEPLAHERS